MGIYFLDIQYNYRYKMLKNIIHDSTYMFSVFGTKTHILYVQEVVTHSYIVTYHIKWVTTSWTDGTILGHTVLYVQEIVTHFI